MESSWREDNNGGLPNRIGKIRPPAPTPPYNRPPIYIHISHRGVQTLFIGIEHRKGAVDYHKAAGGKLYANYNGKIIDISDHSD